LSRLTHRCLRLPLEPLLDLGGEGWVLHEQLDQDPGHFGLRDAPTDTALALRGPAGEGIVEIRGQIDGEAFSSPPYHSPGMDRDRRGGLRGGCWCSCQLRRPAPGRATQSRSARRAALISFSCIGTENRSSASSIADASRCRTNRRQQRGALRLRRSLQDRLLRPPSRPVPSSPAGSAAPCPASPGPDGTRRSHPPAPALRHVRARHPRRRPGEAAPAPRPAAHPDPG
jgi:hypothetical protein